MNKFIVLSLVVLAVVSEGYAATTAFRVKRQVIPKEFQNINIENYIKNERAVRFQLKCIVDEGPCDRIGKYLKTTIPELLSNQCANCDLTQKDKAAKIATQIQEKFPAEWAKAVKKYQPDLVKPEDAAKLEEVTGFKLDPSLIRAGDAAAAPTEATSAAP